MELKELLVRLSDKNFTYLTCADQCAAINNLQLLTDGQKSFSPDILYYGNTSLLPSDPDSGLIFNCIIYGKDSVPRRIKDWKNSNILLLSQDADPNECYNILQGFFIEEQLLTDNIRRLLMALFSNNGLQYLVDEAGAVLGNPIFVSDSSYHYIAYHCQFEPADDSEYAKIIRQELEYNSILENGIEYIQTHKIDEALQQLDQPLTHYNEYIKKNTMTGAVRIRGIIVAHVMMVEQNHPFTEMDRECFARLVLFVGQEMQKLPLYQKNKGQMYSYFLINLLTDKQPSQAVIDRRVKVLHYKMLGKFYLAVLASKNGAFTGQSVSTVADQIHMILTGNIYALHEGRMVILFNREKDASLGQYTEEILHKAAVENSLSIGISNSFEDLTEIHRFYDQALSSIKSGEMLNAHVNDSVLFHYKDYAYMEMLDLCSQHSNLMNFCHPDIQKLMEYDEHNHSDFMETLFIYLLNSENTLRTAKILCMHKNTLLYRLDRIRDILNNDLSSGEDLFMYQLSFRALLFLGLFRPKILPKRSELKKDQEENEGI